MFHSRLSGVEVVAAIVVSLCQCSMKKESHRELSAKFEQLQIKGSSLPAGH